MRKKTDRCPKCGNDRNHRHERDSSQMCSCVDEDTPLSEESEKRLATGIEDALLGRLRPVSISTEEPPTGPVVSCLNCKKEFIWWIHPVQLCDDCVEKEFGKENQ